MQRIALINCFFGEFPWYFDFFIKSCTTNPTVDFIIFSDNKYSKQLPENISIIPFSLVQFNQLATEKLGFEIAVHEAYKICDFRPAFGIIFSGYLADYDFWGMCDIDIVLGRIREFITDELLDEYDVISTRHDYLTGSFMILRNNDTLNNLFTKSKDYQKVFTSKQHYCFDECNFKQIQMEYGMNIFDVPCEIESMEHVVRKEMELGSINVFFDFWVVDGLSGKLNWDNGLLSYDNKFEIILFHLIQYKSNILSKKTTPKVVPNVFYIDKYTFRNKSKKAILGFLEFFYYNKFKPFKFKMKHFIDYFMAIYFRPRLIADIQIGIYKNKLGDTIVNIQKNEKGYNVIMNYLLQSENNLMQSKFNINTFFLKGFPNEKFTKIDIKKSKKIILQKSYLDGNVSNFEMINDITI